MKSSTNYGEQGSDELGAIQKQADHMTNESVESTRRMLGMVAESQEVGIKTIDMLDDQGEKLRRIENGLDNVHAGMDEADRNLDNLEKCCGLCVLPWRRTRHKRRPFTNSSTTASSTKSSSPTTAEPKLRMNGDEGMPSTGYVTRITDDDRETEMDDNLQLVSSYLGNLKNIALDMGDTIANQNQQIDRIGVKNESALDRVHGANKRTQNILQRP